MSIRNFRQIFSIVLALLLAAIGFAGAVALRNVHEVWENWGIQELSTKAPWYFPFTVCALAMLGLLLGTILGPKIADVIIAAGNSLDSMSARDKVAVTLGTVAGLMVALPPVLLLTRIPLFGAPLSALLCVALVYLGVRATMGMRDEFPFFGGAGKRAVNEPEVLVECAKILDTNVIIDGRIADVCRSGFLEGTIYVPGFVLDELQHIADSSDSLKRARGRRGLDILNAMQKDFPLVVRVHDHLIAGMPGGDEVDSRLVLLAKRLGGAIVTNDFNLNKVAELQGVSVLNVNQLANALKPVVLPGEEMDVAIIREGKEQNQGIAYLDDGTMIVVEDGRRYVGETLTVTVTSVLQTVAGKMIFARSKGTRSNRRAGE